MINYKIKGMSNSGMNHFYSYCINELGYDEPRLQSDLMLGYEERLLNKYYLWMEGQVEMMFGGTE